MHTHPMLLTEIHLRNFRNHADTGLAFGRGITALLGRNGQGKTNVLEAVSYLGLTKSFYASSDVTVLQIGKEEFEIDGTLLSDGGTRHRVRVRYVRAEAAKEVLIDGGRPESLAAVIGRFPMVVLSPEHGAITAGGPGERRRFLDIVLSQVGAPYLRDLLEYRRVLRQRNRVLADPRGGGSGALLDPWTEALVSAGARIIIRRGQFVNEFRQYVLDSYRALVDTGERPDLVYRSTVDSEGSAALIQERLARALQEREAEERKRGITLVGPHRDDLSLLLNGLAVREFASQGQHKSILVALKVAEFHYLRDRTRESPILLFDDIFSELDEERAANILGLVTGLGQVILTATDERALHGSVPWDDVHRRILVENGTCRAA